MIKRIIEKIRSNGIIMTLQEAIQRMIGIWGYREELDTLHYFLNAYHNPSLIPSTVDKDLRLLQLCDVQLLRIVTHEITKLGLSYWLDYGTLLGAVRNKGFIPWDDDLDIAMPRHDYNIALIKLKDALDKYDIVLIETDHIGIGYRHEQTGIWLDIFAVDSYYASNSLENVKDNLLKGIKKCRCDYLKHIKKASPEWRAQSRNRYVGGGTSDKDVILYHQPEFKYFKDLIHDWNCVMPLGFVQFENILFRAPFNTDVYLKGIYGNNYMDFPKKGILHHDFGRGPLSTWAKRSNIDMNELYNKLKDIADAVNTQEKENQESSN